MEQNLSKYDILDSKMIKVSKIVRPLLWYTIISKNKKNQLMKNYIANLLNNSHIIFELKSDLSDYLKQENRNPVSFRYIHLLSNIINEFEKIIVLDIIYKNKNYDIISLVIDLLEKKITVADLYSILDDEEREILGILSDNYNFQKLTQKYQNLVLESHKQYMDDNIYPYVTKRENKEIELLKGQKMLEKNIDLQLNINIDYHFPKELKRTPR